MNREALFVGIIGMALAILVSCIGISIAHALHDGAQAIRAGLCLR